METKEERGEPVLWNNFIEAMEKAFGDPDLKQKALVRVNTIKQGRRNFEECLNKFDEVLLQAGGIG